MEKYIETLYLIGCYLVVADHEINAKEVDALNNLFQDAISPELEKQQSDIFSDAEDRPDYRKLLNQLLIVCQSNEQKERAIRYLAQVACADGFVGLAKKKVIDDVSATLYVKADSIIEEEEMLSKNQIDSSRLSRFQRLWGNIQKSYYTNFADLQKQSTLDKMFGGTSFQLVLENITDQAMVDYQRINQIMASIDDSLCNTRRKVSDLSNRSIVNKKELQEIQKVLCEVNNHFNVLINVHLAENKEMLEKKQRNIRFFTIAFMGRTKAGKSTLHKVMTLERNDDIGVGKLRTTRYNRSWYWNKLRIVDTPGIGAPGGEVDTDIAKSIIDEADLICYVVTNDSIQETEFDFFSQIKEHNKPLYIILNVKSNLLDARRMDKFLENPTKWKDTQGRESLQGHFDRIHDKLDGKYNMSAVKIMPIHLLAAQLAVCSDLENEKSNVLLCGSNLKEFTNSVQKEVYDSGCLKKSLSVIEGSAYQIHCINKNITNDTKMLSDNLEILKKSYSRFKQFINTESERLYQDVDNYYESARIRLHNRAASFATEHYDVSNAGDLWNSDVVVENIFNELNSKINSRVEDFRMKAKDEMEELFSDMKMTMDMSVNSTATGDTIINARLGAGIVGALIATATPIVLALCLSNPAGWVIGLVSLGVGLVVAGITALFTSKEEKVRKATEKLRNMLDEEIDRTMTDGRNLGMQQIHEMTENLRNNIDIPFEMYIKGIDNLIAELKDLKRNCEFDESVANSLIGFRILDFIGKSPLNDKKISEIDNNELTNRYLVFRDWEKQTLMYNYRVPCSKHDISKAEAAIQMNIKFNF